MPVYPAGMANPRRFRILVALLCLGIASTAFAWGRLGHALVGDLAERHLDPTAKAEIARLLAGETDPTLAGVASWADDLRDSDPARFKADASPGPGSMPPMAKPSKEVEVKVRKPAGGHGGH